MYLLGHCVQPAHGEPSRSLHSDIALLLSKIALLMLIYGFIFRLTRYLQSMFNMVNGSCASDTATALLNEATAGFADTYFRSSFNCTQEVPVWSTDTSTLDRTIFCGYKEVRRCQR